MSVEAVVAERTSDSRLPPETREREVLPRYFAVIGHTYQPGRRIFLPDGTQLSIVPHVNEQIYQEDYKPNFVDREIPPEGFIFSFYPTLRAWMKQAHPEEFERMREKIQRMPDKEYNVLGDPLIHAILPLLPTEDQEMLLRMGRADFAADFGFEPKGLWLPETAGAKNTFWLARKTGYEFGVTRDNQLISSDQNPVYLQFDDGSEMAIIHFAAGLSGSVSYDEYSTMNADTFLAEWIKDNRQSIAIATDTELYGHHRKGAGDWLRYLLHTETLTNHGFAPLSIRDRLASGNRQYTSVVENSSWSCNDNLGRWTGAGECNCDNPTEDTKRVKRNLFLALSEYNGLINKDLDVLDPTWRDEFSTLFLNLRQKIFTGGDFLTELKSSVLGEKFTLYAAKIYTLLGFTSCGWFFGKEDNPERVIPENMARVVGNFLHMGKVDIDKAELVAVT